MYRLSDIQDSLLHLVGWEQAYDPAQLISDELTESQSGLFYQGEHPLLTLKNIRSIMPDDFVFQYPEWMNITYAAGRKVSHNGKIWIALRENTDVEPTSGDYNNDYNNDYGNPDWKQYNMLSDFLEKETRNGISTMIKNFIVKKVLTNETKNVLENRTLFDGAGRLNAVITNTSKVCGYEITPVRSKGVTMRIHRIGIQATGATGTVRVYIFHSSLKNPYKTLDFELTSQNAYQWFSTPDLYLPYLDDEKDAGGTWYLVYNQNDLPNGLEAINIGRDWSSEPCGTCNRGDVQFWRMLTKYVEFHPFRISAPTDFKDYPEMWDVTQNVYTSAQNYGLNVELTIGCDLTDFIIDQKQMFANVLAKQVTANLLRKIALNPDVKVNRNQVNASRADILYELDGNTAGVRPGGLGADMEKAYKALSLDTIGLDRVCLSCHNGGVKYKTT